MKTFALYLISLVLILAQANTWFIVPRWSIVISWVVFIIFGVIDSYAQGLGKGIKVNVAPDGSYEAVYEKEKK